LACKVAMSFFAFPGVGSANRRCNRLTVCTRCRTELVAAVGGHPQRFQLRIVCQDAQFLCPAAARATECAS